ncbi:hypothetical protein [Aureimonas sp. Leaf324]|uniref:hypothetical protein n=1 Tax=Aureimonas sp. Leaf324 TaxID=1736336 RepID=UPI000700E68A|nr:hypothetical protein [Aureimonas sp. Leaf324]KQQ90970.1 hypothetical protein ASF65_00045 [Aureimonas sp. Leaf324]
MTYAPILVTAVLRNGFVTRAPLSPALDGILAYRHLYEKLGPEIFAENKAAGVATGADDLPVEIVRDGDHRWYSVSAPIFHAAGEQVTFYHRRFDDHIGQDRVVEKQKRVLTTGGPYKAARKMDRKKITNAISWHVIGDRPEIERLLSHITQVGSARGRGYGEVVEWRYGEGDEVSARLNRALPIDYARRHGLPGRTIEAALHPPAWLPESRTMCIVPDVQAVEQAA